MLILKNPSPEECLTLGSVHSLGSSVWKHMAETILINLLVVLYMATILKHSILILILQVMIQNIIKLITLL